MKKILMATLFAVATTAFAWEPSKPVNAVIGFAPGSGNAGQVMSNIARTTGSFSIVFW